MPAFRHPPIAGRPESPPENYGVPAEGGELMPWSFVLEQLAAAPAYWLVTVGSAGRPHAMPIWGALVDDDLFMETSPGTRKARNLLLNPAAVVHTPDPDRVVVVEGRVRPVRPTLELGRSIAAAFAAKYAGYQPEPTAWDAGGLYVLEPSVVFAWRDMPTATRWRFG